MGNHRADHSAPRPDSTLGSPSAGSSYVGKRVAGRVASEETPSTYVGKRVARPAAQPLVEPTQPVVEPTLAAEAVTPARALDRMPTVELPALRDIPLADGLSDSSTTLRAVAPAGKRRAVKHAGSPGPLFRGLPTLPVAVGVATIAIAVGGVVTSADPQLASAGDRLTSPNALTGSFGSAAVGTRTGTVSRDSDRDALAQGADDSDLVKAAERSAAERTTALSDLTAKAQKEATEIALNKWVLPLDSYRLTATFGEYGLWSNYHTGLDFAAPPGTPIRAVANGTVTSAQFDGAYGNKTVVTLEDGTELWFCHQTSFNVSAGDTVRAGEIIGYVGSTGHVTGPHLHLEVRPGGGDPVDPDAALRQHGVTP
ncbi:MULTISPECIES: M23 family metallopeptidase [unclassified Nocardioides]|uniref:M23 family metallopeptidase n=1 Tax=unclassified Nocardioides TaxID=2615069 RepID=UPI00116B0389|nr:MULTISPECIES: M23 family metallopeptidase [unclassified Nocardioides]TQK72597.1 peptidase M23-like protein [Nocardioides sp. SLBN-35]WGY03198.1 M23 family metallopeptidase [Nocardioides sp. QY071]